MQYLGAISKMISVCFYDKPLNKTTVIQVHALTTNVEETEAERFYEELKTFWN